MNQVLISYVPLTDINSICKITSGLPSGSALGCIWVEKSGNISPVFIYNGDAKERYEHIIEWSEDNIPSKSFNIFVMEHDNSYGVALFPMIGKSMHDSNTVVVTKPPIVICSNTEAFKKVKHLISKEQIEVGFVDKHNINNPYAIYWFNPILVGHYNQGYKYIQENINALTSKD
jgi:hypothetical protein